MKQKMDHYLEDREADFNRAEEELAYHHLKQKFAGRREARAAGDDQAARDAAVLHGLLEPAVEGK